MKNIVIPIFLLIVASCSAQRHLTVEELPETWVNLTKTDSGFIHETHYDMGSTFLQIRDSMQVQLIADQSLIVFNIEKYLSSKLNSFECNGEYTFGARLNGEKPENGELRFKWVDKEKEIGLWTIKINKKEVLKEYFTTQDRIKDYPIITTGDE
ncbi:hypothetical protein [Prolixibacter denitrificans]|nr:hypothetical protein [Prolixibacter denitrificans]